MSRQKKPMAEPVAFKRTYDVWSVRGVTVDTSWRTIVRLSYPESTRFQHEYQRLLGQVDAFTAAEAERLVLSGMGARP